MAESLTRAIFPQLTQASKYNDVAHLHSIYTEVARQAAWLDFRARVFKMRTDIVAQLLAGTRDKFGQVRDDEKRAVLHVLDRLLAFPDMVSRQYDDLTKRKDELERKHRRTSIHSEDVLNMTYEESPGV